MVKCSDCQRMTFDPVGDLIYKCRTVSRFDLDHEEERFCEKFLPLDVEKTTSFKCPAKGCGAEYQTWKGLSNHVTRSHGHLCRVCNKVLPSESQRHNHEFTAHFTNIRVYRAWVMGKGWLWGRG